MAEPDPEPTAAWAAGGTVWPESGPARVAAGETVTGLIHHLEFWVPDLDRSVVSWGWLLDELGYKPFGDWPGGRRLFTDRHPYAGGEGHYAAYLENPDGFEVELVAPSPGPPADRSS